MKAKTILLFLLCSFLMYSQNLSVRAGHPVYDFLNKLRVKGVLPYYDDVVLPLTRSDILSELKVVQKKKINLSALEIAQLNFYLDWFSSDTQKGNSFFSEDSFKLTNHFFNETENYAYLYHDSLVTFSVAPIVTFKDVYLKSPVSDKLSSLLISYGGAFSFEYDSWFSGYLEAWNGFQGGSRTAALTDQRVAQSYSFNKTGLSYFDQTTGYLTLKKGIFKLQLGRERILWGADRLNPMIFSQSSQTFDFVKFDFSYKHFTYTFLHGWLVQPTNTAYIDSLGYDVKTRNSKYIVSQRFGFQPLPNLSIGVGQQLIYANRPVELAYLTPFIFLESAQRSLNDLDNGFLNFDVRYRPQNGIELNGTLTLDDLNFEFLKKGKWNSAGNRLAWQTGFTISNPILPEQFVVMGDYMQIRPYTYSHPNGGESLTYTNNGFPLGVSLQPNSAMITLKGIYEISPKLALSLQYKNIKHGDNVVDANGTVVTNVGGDVLTSYRKYFASDGPNVSLFDGVVTTSQLYQFTLQYLLSYNLNLLGDLSYLQNKSDTKEKTSLSIFVQLNYNFF